LNLIRRLLVALICRIAGWDVRSVTTADYEQACAAIDFNGASHVGAYNYSVTLAIQKSERGRLSTALREFAAEHNLQFFDVRRGSSSFPSRRIAVLSPRGLHVHADMVTKNTAAMGNIDMLSAKVILVGSTLANHDEWPPVLRALDTMLRTQWPDKAGPERLSRVEAINVPDLESWKGLTSQEQHTRIFDYSEREEARPLVQSIVDDFRRAHGHVEGLVIRDQPGSYHGGEWVIDVTYPFIFDRRSLPRQHLGVRVHAGPQLPLPPEFENQNPPDGYAWSPPNFERFVDRCANEIRQRLGNPTMSRAEMLDALVGMPFEEFVAHCRESVRKGSIPPFE
jgi:hypothetical protein